MHKIKRGWDTAAARQLLNLQTDLSKPEMEKPRLSQVQHSSSTMLEKSTAPKLNASGPDIRSEIQRIGFDAAASKKKQGIGWTP